MYYPAHTLCICPFCLTAARSISRVKIPLAIHQLKQASTEVFDYEPPAWSISTQTVFYMGRYGELVKPADCKSVTLVVNIAGSSPARPTICSRVPTGRGIRLKPGSVRVQSLRSTPVGAEPTVFAPLRSSLNGRPPDVQRPRTSCTPPGVRYIVMSL